MEVTPGLILAMWASGMAGGSAVVSHWAIVGAGYSWRTAAVVALVGGATVVAAGPGYAMAATGAALLAGIFARRRHLTTLLFALSGLGFLVVATRDGGVIPAFTGTIVLGGMTSEMMLGHWFLIDPKLPRWALQRLDLVAAIGLVLDLAVVATMGGFGADDGVLIAAMVALSAMTGVLTVAVWFSLREPGYPGVMAATGLSYLGVLTTFGVVVVGRLLLAGL